MQEAINLGEKGRVTAPPNPWVGCIIVKGGQKIGEGFHRAAGEPHAEVEALKQAGQNAEGADAYVTLEPCSHHGRTPPCVEALIKAKISRVVIGTKDPDINVSGKGITKLQEAGIKVQIESGGVEHSLEPYLYQRKTGRPFIVLKAATSIDGRVAAADGSSEWISSAEARKDAHKLRAESQGILVGAGTYLNDSPKLTVRDVEQMPLKQPLRIVLDGKRKLSPNKEMILATQKKEPQEGWKEVIQYTSIDSLLEQLTKRGVIQLLVEGGGNVLGSFIKEKLFNQIILYIAPKILGDQGIPLFQNLPILSIQDAPELSLKESQQLGNTLRLTLSLKGKASC